MFRLNYRGQLSDQVGAVMGPNTLNEYLEVGAQSYDAMTNQTTLVLKIFRMPA